MKRAWIWVSAIVLLAVTANVFGQARGARATGGGGATGGLNLAFYTGQYDIMVQQLTLTDDPKAKLQDRVANMNKEIDAFLANAPAQIAAGRRGARGAGGAQAANPVVIKMQNDLQLLVNEHQVIINQVLTPEQRVAWETYKLNRVLDPRLRILGLSDDQADKIKTLIDVTARSLAALNSGKTVQTLQGQLFRKIISDVLTDDQVGKYVEGALAVQGAATRAAGGAGGAGGAAGHDHHAGGPDMP